MATIMIVSFATKSLIRVLDILSFCLHFLEALICSVINHIVQISG